MRRKEIKTLEEYYQRRKFYNKALIGYYIVSIIIMAGVALFLYTWHDGLLRNFKIARYGTISMTFLALWMVFGSLEAFFFRGRYTEFYPAWLTAFYESCPKWVKNIAIRSCERHSKTRPEEELPYLAFKLKLYAGIFIIGGSIFLGLMLVSIYKNASFINILYRFSQI